MALGAVGHGVLALDVGILIGIVRDLELVDAHLVLSLAGHAGLLLELALEALALESPLAQNVAFAVSIADGEARKLVGAVAVDWAVAETLPVVASLLRRCTLVVGVARDRVCRVVLPASGDSLRCEADGDDRRGLAVLHLVDVGVSQVGMIMWNTMNDKQAQRKRVTLRRVSMNKGSNDD